MINLTNSILQFWFDKNTQPKWFVKDENFDKEIKDKFLDDYNFLKDQLIEELTQNKKIGQLLTRIIILDQFPRNIFRGLKESFATDEKALAITKFIINNNMDVDIAHEEKLFIYLPLMHSENLQDQELCVNKFRELDPDNPNDFAIRHKEIIEKFGRFPHRNEILGRKSSKEELEFLKQPGSSF